MNSTLRDVADAYDRESHSLWVSQRDRWRLQNTAAFFRRMLCNRAAADPKRLKLTYDLLLDIPSRWCSQHGYRAIAGIGGWTLQRGSEPVIIASIGDTLLWDEEQITVAPSGS